MHSVADRLSKSQQTLSWTVLLEITSALSVDIGDQNQPHSKLLDTLSLYRPINPELIDDIEFVYTRFRDTCIRQFLSPINTNTLLHSFPHAYEALNKWGFIDPKFPRPKLPPQVSTSDRYVSTGSIGLSFGSNLNLFSYLLASSLGIVHKPLLIYLVPLSTCIFPEFSSMVARQFNNVDLRYLDQHYFSYNDYFDINSSGGVRLMRQEVDTAFYNFYGIEGECKDPSQSGLYPLESDFHMFTKATKAVNRILHQDFTDSRSSYLNTVQLWQRPYVLVCNRDSQWVGPGQLHRDTSIDIFLPLIQSLIQQGFGVVRFNTVGYPLNFKNDFFLDLTLCPDLPPLDQYRLASDACFVIGSDTGVTGFAQVISGSPTLVVDSSTLLPHSPWGNVVYATKKLFPQLDSSYYKDSAFTNVFFDKTTQWDAQFLNKHSLRSIPLSKDDLLHEGLSFIECFSTDSFMSLPTLQDLNLSSSIPYNTVLTYSTYSMLKSLING